MYSSIALSVCGNIINIKNKTRDSFLGNSCDVGILQKRFQIIVCDFDVHIGLREKENGIFKCNPIPTIKTET